MELNRDLHLQRGTAAAVQYNAIMIPQDLLDILVCPVCKKPLIVQGNQESLKCGACHRVYPVRDGIPILLVDEAKIEVA